MEEDYEEKECDRRRCSAVHVWLSEVLRLLFTVSADAMRVVTLGADLSKEQMNTMLRYFKVNADEVEIMYITNEDEQEHLSDYVPLSQIGTRTVSCAYVASYRFRRDQGAHREPELGNRKYDRQHPFHFRCEKLRGHCSLSL